MSNIKTSVKKNKDHLLNHVSTWKREIVQKLALKKNIIFIGVHNRRTDYSHHYEVISHSTLVDEAYFNTAFEIYRYLFIW